MPWRFNMGADTLSYIEVGDAYFRRDWHAAINSYWSPLYSWLISVPVHVFKVPLYWESTGITLVNFLIYVFVLCSLEFLLNSFVFHLAPSSHWNRLASLPPWALRVIGYALLLYSSVAWISPGRPMPDLLVAGIVLLVTGVIIRLSSGGGTWANYALLGLLLGLGYLTKVVLFPLAFVFFAMSVLAAGFSRRTIAGLSAGLAVFALVSAPFIYALSTAKGRFCYGDSGRNNYSRYVNGVNYSDYYEVRDKRFGAPIRHVKKALDSPPVYILGDTFPAASYPPWYDPTYWWEGVVPRWDTQAEIGIVHQHLHFYYGLFVEQTEFVTGFLTILFLSRRYSLAAGRFLRAGFIWIPGVVACAGYALINVESRFLPGFLIPLWLCLFWCVPLPQLGSYRRVVSCAVMAIVAVVGARVVPSIVVDAGHILHQKNVQWEIAEQLQRMGVNPGDKVAAIGFNLEAYWAHLAGVRIVAEVAEPGAGEYWVASSGTRAKVSQAFIDAGAKAIVCNRVPVYGTPFGWLRVDQSDYFVRSLSRQVGP